MRNYDNILARHPATGLMVLCSILDIHEGRAWIGCITPDLDGWHSPWIESLDRLIPVDVTTSRVDSSMVVIPRGES